MKTRWLFGVAVIAITIGSASELSASTAVARSFAVASLLSQNDGVVDVSRPATESNEKSSGASKPQPSSRATPGAAASPNNGGLTLGWKELRELFMGLSGVPMWALVACSILTFMFVVERMTVLQSRRIMPRAFVNRFLGQLREGELDRAKTQELVQVCRDNDCPIAHFFSLVAENAGRPSFEIRVTVSDHADSELFHLRKHIRAISALAMLAPLLGLFGTVLGMISAFQALSQQTGSGKTELLASGISLALVATASGLGVAIAASVAYYVLLGRVDRLIQEMDVLTNQAISLVASDGRGRETEKKPRKGPVIPGTDQK